MAQTRNAPRMAEFRKRMKAEGFEQVHGWVHSHQLSDLIALIQRLRADPDLDAGPVRRASTGRLERV